MKTKRKSTGAITNRRANYDYELGDSLEVGIELTGAETKALRLGHGQLRGAYVTILNGELWLINANIIGSRGLYINPDEQTRSRKLLARRREIDRLEAAKHQGVTIVPTALLIKGRYIKLKIALGKGKKHYDKRQTIKRRQQERDARSAMKQ